MNFSKNTLACILAVASGSLLVGCREDVLRQPGIIGTLVLAGIVLMVVCAFMVLRLNRLLSVLSLRKAHEDREALKEEILNLEDHDVDELLQKRRAAMEFQIGRASCRERGEVKA